MANLEKKQPSEEYKKIRCLFEEMVAARDRDDVILEKEFRQNAYSLCITAVRLGIN